MIKSTCMLIDSISFILGVILVYPYWLHSGFLCTICQMCVCHWTWCHALEMCWCGKLDCCPHVKAWPHQWLSDGIFLSRICLSRQQLYSVLKAWSLHCVHSFCLPTSWLHTSNLKVSSFATFFFFFLFCFRSYFGFEIAPKLWWGWYPLWLTRLTMKALCICVDPGCYDGMISSEGRYLSKRWFAWTEILGCICIGVRLP